MQKDFLTHNQQMKRLRDSKKIVCSGSIDKEILCRTGYFNLINGYKQPFVASMDENGNHIYYRGTSIREIYALKQFDDNLRSILLKQITKVEEEIRALAAYKFDEVNDNGKIAWFQIEAYDAQRDAATIMKVISSTYHDVELSKQEYVQYYLKHHKFIPTWIMVKVISFSNFINFLNCSKDKVKKSICTIYGIIDNDDRCDFELLIGSLHWLRTIRNVCAHNERVYTVKHKGGRIKTKYMDMLAPSYLNDRDKRVIDLLVFMKYFTPHNEYQRFISDVEKTIEKLQREIRRAAFDKVRAELGFKDMNHLKKLCENKKVINYNKLSTL